MTRSRLRTLVPLTGAVVAAGLLAACGSSADGPPAGAAASGSPTSTDNCGRTVEVTTPPERIVAINQPATELLLSLGLQDRMAAYGVSDDDFLPSLQDRADEVEALDDEFVGLESLLDLEPDFVYATFAYTFSPEGVAPHAAFAELDIPTYQSPSECGGQDARQDAELTLDDLYAEITELAGLLGVEDRGEALVDELSTRAEEVSVDLDAGDVSLAWWYSSTRTPYIAGCCGAPGLMTRAVGATNAFEDADQLWPETGWEAILDRDPDVLVLADLERGDDGDSAEAKIRFLESDPVASRLTAVKARRYVVLDGTTMDPSVRNVDGIEQLATGLRDLGLV